MTPLKIGICGAGIGGLTAAAALARDGHKVTIYDRFEHPAPVGSGLVVQPVGQHILHWIGALNAAQALGQPIHRMIGHETRRGRRVLDVSYASPGRARFGLGIHRAALFQTVLDAALAAGATLQVGHQVTGVTDAARRQIQFKGNGTSPAYDLVIDASGAHSPLSPLRARPLPYGAIWSTVDWPEGAGVPDDHLSQRYRSAHRMAGVLPVGHLPGQPGRKAAIFWSLPRDAFERWRNTPLDSWKDEATTLWPDMARFLAGITGHDQMTAALYSHGTLRTPSAHGLIHIGDAAHRASPQLGQGANMAMLDAAALAIALRDCRDLETGLARYVQIRRWHLGLYQVMSAIFTPLYQSGHALPPALRDHVLTPLSRLYPMPRLLTRLVCGDLIRPFPGWSDL